MQLAMQHATDGDFLVVCCGDFNSCLGVVDVRHFCVFLMMTMRVCGGDGGPKHLGAMGGLVFCDVECRVIACCVCCLGAVFDIIHLWICCVAFVF